MGVLEARKDAEVIGYSIIGEEKEDASNVIDYDIHDELTIDNSSVFNANNDTTTGMANVIPGVNAPKLIESTSIYKNVPSKTAYAVFSGSGNLRVEAVGDIKTGLLRPLTISNQGGGYTFNIGEYFNGVISVPDAALIVPASGIYLVKVTYYSSVNSLFRYYDLYNNLDLIHTFRNDNYYSQTGSAYPTEEIYINANKGDQLAIYFNVYTTVSGWIGTYVGYSASVDITKVG